MRTGLVWLTICFALGIALGLAPANRGEVGPVISILAALPFIMYRTRTAPLRGLFLSVSAGIIYFITGVLTGSTAIQRPVDDVSRWTHATAAFPVMLIGGIKDISFSADTVRSLILKPDSLCFRNACVGVSGGVYTGWWVPDRDLSGDLVRSARIHIRGWLESIEESGNPGDFDRGTWLDYQGIHAVLTPFPGQPVLISAPLSRPLLSRMRDAIRMRIESGHRDAETVSLLRAMLTGERGVIDSSIRSEFKSAGAAHLLAVSGLHVAIIAAVIFGLVSSILSRTGMSFSRVRVCRAILTAVTLAIFAGITGFTPSVVRGSIMAGTYITGRSLERRTSPWNILALSGLVILTFQPLSLQNVGFQLSFGAVAAILISQNGGSHTITGLYSVLISLGRSIRITAFILVLTGPILLMQFGTVALMGLISNPVTIPVFGLFLVLGIVSTLFGPHGYSGDVTEIIGRFLLDLVAFFARAAEHLLTASSVATLFSVLVAVVLGFVLIRRNGMILKKFVFPALAVFFTFLLLSGSRDDVLKGIFLDVGQGDAALFRFPSGATMLVDTGPDLHSGDDILRQASRLGFSRIDVVVLSHFHQDHAGGLARIASQMQIGRVVFPGNVEEKDDHYLRDISADFRTLSAGDTLLVDSSAYIQVLAPRERSSSPGGNESTLVLSMHYGDISFLLLGDTEMREEKIIVSDYGLLLNSDVIKIPHHGSRTSSHSSLVRRAVIPGRSWCVVSVGVGNAFGHPDADIVDRWISSGSKIWITSRSGSFSFKTDGISLWRSL